jgi:hypothetical protein
MFRCQVGRHTRTKNPVVVELPIDDDILLGLLSITILRLIVLVSSFSFNIIAEASPLPSYTKPSYRHKPANMFYTISYNNSSAEVDSVSKMASNHTFGECRQSRLACIECRARKVREL